MILGEGPIFDINDNFDSPEKKFRIDFSKANTKSCLSLHYNGDNSCLLVNGKEIYDFKADNHNVNFPTQFCLGSIFNKYCAIGSREVSIKWNVYDFSVYYNAIDKSIDIMIKNNT